MSTSEIKQKLHIIIDNSNAEDLKGFYILVKDYFNSSENSKTIAASEIDIKLGKIHSQAEV